METKQQTFTPPPVAPCNQFKYRFKELFIFFFGAKDTEAKKDFCQQACIDATTLWRDFNHRLTDPGTIPYSRLLAYSQYLKVPVDKLRNHINQ